MTKETIQLNPAQAQAVAITDGPALVVAGAGTGKTKVIVERIAKLVDHGIEKQNILALTFTEKAAQEMLDRVGEQLDNSYGAEMNIYTFNAFGQEMLQEFAIEIGLSPNLKLIGDIGKTVLLREHLDELELEYFSPVSNPDGQLADLGGYFSRLKQQLIKPEEYAKFANTLPSGDEAEAMEKLRHQELAQAFGHYQRIARNKNTIDYDDQLYLLVEMLEMRPNVLKKLQMRFTHILVDEFQDTNPMQSKLLDLLAGENQNLMAVGDDDQSIYGWRGATLANILDFTKRYPNAREITLIENFRSTQDILDASYRLIQENNPDRLEHLNNLDKKLIAHRGSGNAPQIRRFSTIDTEMDWVARDIERRIQDGTDPGQIAILARRSAGVIRMHAALELHDIEHAVLGITNNLYDQPIVATMIEALRIITDPHDNSAMYHALGSILFDVEPHVLGELSAVSRKQNLTFEQAVTPEHGQAIHRALELINQWRELVHTTSVGRLSYMIIEATGLKDSLLSRAEESEQDALVAQALFQWFSTLRAFEEVSDVSSSFSYLQNLEALKAEGETIDDGTSQLDNSQPVVMTVHKSKGLEWEVVYIVDCTEGSFPLKKRGSSLAVPEALSKSSSADDHYNEERRLMYVATTRARDQVILTHSDSHTGTTKRKPSRFLIEMFGDLDEEVTKPEQLQASLDLFNSEIAGSKLEIPGSMMSGGNLVLTASQANDYLRCPLDFKYRHILGVPPEPSPHATVGTLFHSYMQRINDAKMHSHQIPEAAELVQDLELNWPKEGYLSSKQRQRAMKLGLESLRETYTRVVAEPIPVASEEPFKIHIPNSKMILKGRIDVVLPIDDDGVEIRDYKTSTSATTADKAKKSTGASKQLEMYALAWRIKHNDMPKLVSLDFVQTNQIGSVKKQPKTLDNLEAKLAQAAEDILSGNFTLGYNHDYCRHPKPE